MGIDVVFSVKEDILIAIAKGQFDPVADEHFDRQVAQEALAGGFSKVLIDYRKVSGMPSLEESYLSGAKLSERGFNPNTQLALLDQEVFKKANDFYSLVARNRGFRVRHFYSRDAAIEWFKLD